MIVYDRRGSNVIQPWGFVLGIFLSGYWELRGSTRQRHVRSLANLYPLLVGCFWNSDAMKKPEGSRGYRDQLNLTLQKLGYLSTSSPNPATVAPLGCAFEFSSVANKLLKYSSDILVMYPSYSRFWSALDLILLVRFSTPRKAHGLVGPIFMLGPFASGLSNTPVPAPACHPYHRSGSISSISPPYLGKPGPLASHMKR
jgi:hypothetical protein